MNYTKIGRFKYKKVNVIIKTSLILYFINANKNKMVMFKLTIEICRKI